MHYYVIVITKPGFDSNSLKAHLSDFNAEFFSLDTLQIKNMMLHQLSSLVYVEKFENATKAKAYFDAVKQRIDVFEGLTADEYKQFIISAGNFSIYYNDKGTDKYLEFFNSNYASTQ